MTDATNSSSGTNVADLGLGVSINEDGDVVKRLEEITGKAVHTAESFDKISESLDRHDAAIHKVNQGAKTTIQALAAQAEALNRDSDAYAALEKVLNRASEVQAKFITSIKEQVETFGMGSEQLLRYKAAQMGILEQIDPLIEKLQQLRREEQEAASARRNYQDLWKNLLDEKDAAIAAAKKEAEERKKIEQARDVELHQMREAERKAEEARAKDYVSFWEKALNEKDKAEERQKQIQQSRDIEMMNTRAKHAKEYVKFWEDALNEQDKIRAQTAKLAKDHAEKEAIDEVRWAEYSTKKKVELLNRYNALKAAGVSKETIDKETGNSSVSKHIGELTALTAILKEQEVVHHSAKKSAMSFSEALENIRFSSSRARSELIVLAHEAVQGRWTRMPASLMVMAEYTDMSALAFTGLGRAILGVGGVVASVGILMLKGAMEQREMANALIFTGNYAGQTTESLMDVARAASHMHGTIGTAKETVLALAQSGRITGDSFQNVASAITIAEEATGRSIKELVAEFETLAVQATGHTKRASETISLNLIKLNDKYHFLTLEVYEQIRALELEGKQREASSLALDTYAKVVEERSKQAEASLGYVESAWHKIKRATSEAIDAVKDWGKTEGANQKLVNALKEQADAQKKLNDLTDPNASHDRLTSSRIAVAQQNLEAANKKVKDSSLEVMRLQERIQEQQEKAINTDAAIHAAQAIRQSDAQIQKKSMGELAVAVREYGEQLEAIAKVDPKSPLLSQEAVNARYAALLKEHTPKTPKTPTKGSDDRAAALRRELEEIKNATEIAMAGQKAQYDLISQYNDLGVISDQDAYEAKLRILKTEEAQKVDSYNRQLDALKNFHAKTKVEIQDKARQEATIRSQIIATQIEEQAKQAKLTLGKEKKDQATVESIVSGVVKTGADEVKDLEKRIDKQKEYNFAIGKSKDVIDAAKRATEERKIAENEASVSYLENLLKDESLSEIQKTVFGARLEWLKQIIAKQKELSALEGVAENEDAKIAAAKLLTKQLNDTVDASKRFAKSMKEAFGSTGEAIGGVVVALAEYGKKQDEIENRRKEALNAKGADKAAVNEKAELDLMQNKLQTYADMAGAAKGFFGEQSNGYKMMMGLQKTAHAIQVAMMIKEMTMMATKAVMNQASGGDPWTAWARMAGMAAAMAALGFAVGGGFNKVSGGEMSKEEMQKKNGKGTVLGDVDARSESIKKSLERLKDNSDATTPVSLAMLKSLRGIESSMNNLARIVASSVGITTGKPEGFETYSRNNYKSMFMQSGVLGTLGAASTGGMLLGPLGALLGAKSVKKELEDSGLGVLGGKTVGELMQGDGFAQYATSKTTTKRFFGLQKSVDYDQDIKKLDGQSDLSRNLSLIFTNLTQGLTSASKQLGYNAQNIEANLKDVRWNKDNLISLRDLKGQELSDALNAWVSKMTDQVTAQVFGKDSFLQEFRHIGEGYAETIIRVAGGFEKAKTLLEGVDVKAIEVADVVNKQGDVSAEIIKQSIHAAETVYTKMTYTTLGSLTGVGKVMEELDGTGEELIATYKSLVNVQRQLNNAGLGEINTAMIQGAGGIDELGKSVGTFIDRFYNDSEKFEMMRSNFEQDMKKLGIQTVPQTRKEFRALVENLAKDTSESGQKLLARVLALSGGFDDMRKASEDLTGQLEDDSQKIKDAWKDVTTSIVDEIKRIRGLVNGDSATNYAQAQAAFATGTAQARAGDQDAAKKLPQLSQDLLALAEKSASSLEDLNFIRSSTANSLEDTVKLLKEKFGFTIEGFAGGGEHVGGYRIVGERGPELEATGPSRIFSSQQTRAILGGDSKEELNAIHQELVQLRIESNAQQVAIARNTEKMQKVLVRNDTGNGILFTDTAE